MAGKDARRGREREALTADREDAALSPAQALADARRLLSVSRAVADAGEEARERLDPKARALALRLAAEGPSVLPARVDDDDLGRALSEAIAAAVGSVYLCRRVAHASGRCWFDAAGPERGRCGEILAAAHRLGDAA